jgi:hypothetical protein
MFDTRLRCSGLPDTADHRNYLASDHCSTLVVIRRSPGSRVASDPRQSAAVDLRVIAVSTGDFFPGG